MKKNIKIIFTGGGSGGHTMPAVSLINEIKTIYSSTDIILSVLYIGSKDGVEKDITTKNNINYLSISTGKLRRYFSVKNFIDFFKILKGLFQSFKIIKNFKPDLLFSTGGFVSVPPVIAAKLRKVHVIIHEQTIDAGLANKISSYFADRICLTFSESQKYFPKNKSIVTGIPLRDEIYNGDIKSAYKRFNFNNSLPVLFFFGGGLGCHKLNEIGLKIIPELLDHVNIIFQTGKSNEGHDFKNLNFLKSNLEEDKKNRLYIFDFINDEIGDIYKITDLVIGRSGAGTVCELLSLKLPSIFIPLAIATNNEQFKNAEIMSKIGGAVIIEESKLAEKSLKEIILDIIYNKKYILMKERLNSAKNPDGKKEIIRLITDEINKIK